MPRSVQSHRTRSKTIQLKLSKLLPASPEEVFDMWLDAESFHRWMRPSEAELVSVELHPVVGGAFRFDLRESDGRIFAHWGQYLEIQRPKMLKFTWNSTVLGDRSSQVTVEFTEQVEGCLMLLQHDLPDDDVIFQDHLRGWAVILDRFAETQRSERE